MPHVLELYPFKQYSVLLTLVWMSPAPRLDIYFQNLHENCAYIFFWSDNPNQEFVYRCKNDGTADIMNFGHAIFPLYLIRRNGRLNGLDEWSELNDSRYILLPASLAELSM